MRINRLFERYSALFMLTWLMLTSYLQAAGIAALAGAAVGDHEPNRRRLSKLPTPAPRQHRADLVIERNPFDSSTELRGPVSTPPVAQIDTDPLSAPQCDSTEVVIVSQARDPTWSVAALQTPFDLRPRDHRVGDRVAGKTVEFIGFNPKQNAPSVWLSSEGRLCQTSLFASRPQAPSISRTATTLATGDARNSSLFSHLRVLPERKGGTIVGIRLFGIRSDSLLRLIGLENGDRLESINGLALGTPEQALGAFAQLRSAARLALSIERRGAPLTLTYRID